MNLADLFSLQTLSIVIGIGLGVTLLIKAAKSLEAQKRSSEPGSAIKARKVLGASAQQMYLRLLEAFPDHIVLAQVAFSALLDTRLQTTRDQFDRKVADFVICTKAFEVIGIIELDDAGRRDRAPESAAGDRLLAQAGYEVCRYQTIPDAQSLRAGLIPVAVNNGIQA